MTSSNRLALFVVGTVAVFGAAFGLGRVVGPVDEHPPRNPQAEVEADHDGVHP